MNVFLPGASGFVGERVLRDLLAAGHEVTALAHSERSRNQLQAAYPKSNAVVGDVASLDDMLRAMPDGIDAVIYLPGLLREFPKKGVTFRRVHVEGVRNTLEAARRNGATRWVQLSALGAGPNATTEYFRTKYEAEQLIQHSGLEWTIMRPSLIFDDRPRKEHNFAGEVAKAIRMAPFVPVLGSGRYLLQPVSLDDVSQAIVRSLTNAQTVGRIYELGGPEKMSYREVVRRIAKAIGTRKPAISIPLSALLFVARALDRFAWFPITADEVAMLRDGNYVRDLENDRAAREMFDLPMVRFTSEAVARLLSKANAAG